MGKNRENRGRAAAKMKRQARRQDERPESEGGGQRAALMRPTSDRNETDNDQERGTEQRSLGAERTPATLRDNGDDEEGIISVPLMVGGIERMPRLRNDEGRGSYSS